MEAESSSNIWKHTRCSEITRYQKVIQIEADTPIVEGCQILVKNGISSAPVWCNSTKSYIGMLDFRDLVDFVLLVSQAKGLKPIIDGAHVDVLEKIIDSANLGTNIQVKDVSDLSKQNPFYSVMEESPLEVAVDILGSVQGIHRINVMHSDGTVVGVLSQTDIVRFIESKSDIFKHILSQSIGDLKMSQKFLTSINAESSVIDALQKMTSLSLTALPVIDEEGKLIGNISMTDIRFIFQNHGYSRLSMKCAHFVAMALSQKGFEHEGRDLFPVYDVYETSTLEYTIQKLLATRTHHMWVINLDRRPIGVVSDTDVIRKVVGFED